ncbi:MAG: phage antirepressor N-terminal domain-containing protein [Ktedonobacterales bacterium]
MGASDEHVDDVLVPIEQDSVIFYGHPLIAVRMADGRIFAVLRWLCEGLRLDPSGQLERINRKTALREGLERVRVETDGGPQIMPALTLDVLPGWLFGIDETRVKPETREDVIVFQRECVRVLAEHFASKARAALPAPTDVVPTHLPMPTAPTDGAPRDAWRAYHRDMLAWYEWQDDIERFRADTIQRQAAIEIWRERTEARLQDHEHQLGELHARSEGDEEVSRMLVEMMKRQPPLTLTPAHQATAKAMVKRLHESGGAAYSTIYAELCEHFHVGKYGDIPDARWIDVTRWFQTRIEAAEKQRQR